MRMSCNGCRVLRKGCSENCPIRPSLQWIKTPQSQANATVFLAKFYGRAALQNLINAGPHHLRPEILRSLLYEACGRIVNPIYGSAGLLWSGNWQLCHAAVEAVLNGAPISPETAASDMSPPLEACDIRHVSKEDASDGPRDLNKVRNRGRFKRAGKKPKGGVGVGVEPAVDEAVRVMLSWSNKEEASRRSRGEESGGDGDSVSVETVEAALAKGDGSDVELELTLGIEPPLLVKAEKVEALKSGEEIDGSDDATCGVRLGL